MAGYRLYPFGVGGRYVGEAKSRAIEPMQLLEMLRHRRSSRSGYIEHKSVTDEQIELILEAGRAAPSAGNAQPWEFIIIRDRDTRHQIADLFKRQLSDKLDIERTIRHSTQVGASLGWRMAPVLILVLGDPRTSMCFPLRTREDKADSHFFSSLANATLQMMLMAECLGLSSQYISDVASPYFSLMLETSPRYSRRTQGLPPRAHRLCLRCGRSEQSTSARAMAHYDRYDRRKQRTVEDLRRFMQQDLSPVEELSMGKLQAHRAEQELNGSITLFWDLCSGCMNGPRRAAARFAGPF